MSSQYALRKELGQTTLNKFSGIIGNFQVKQLKDITDQSFTTIAFQADVNAYFGTIFYDIQEEVKILFEDGVYETLDELIGVCDDNECNVLCFVMKIYKLMKKNISINEDLKSGTEFNLLKDMIKLGIKNQVDNMHIINEITSGMITFCLWIVSLAFLRLEIGIEKKTKLSLTMKMLKEIIPIVITTINMFDPELSQLYKTVSDNISGTMSTKPAPKPRKPKV